MRCAPFVFIVVAACGAPLAMPEPTKVVAHWSGAPLPGSLRADGEACAAGDLSRCFDLGVAMFQGKGTAVDYETARSLFEETCAKGFMRGCNSLGNVYMMGKGAPEDPARAYELYKKA
jgi:TPR repeat protein